MRRSAEELLEFGRLRDLLRRQTTSALGGRAVDALAFSTDREKLQREFAAIAEAVQWLRQGSEMGFGGLVDPGGWFSRIVRPGAVLEAAELLEVASLADAAGWLREAMRDTQAQFPLLTEKARAAGSPATNVLAASIRRAIEPDGQIRDDASAELRRVRAGKGSTRESIQSALQRILRTRGETPGEDYITQRNDRYVIPVRATERRGVQGVVHAASATGQTLFLEPLETIELNNRLVQLSEEEAAEIARILEELTGRVTALQPVLAQAAETIGEFDALFARGRFARDYEACMPEFTAEPGIVLEVARHPVLESGLRKQGRSIVPLTLAMGGGETVLVISGPNTGGKTVALKTVGLAVMAAQTGIPVAADSARLGIFDRVLADIGDEQSITADLSTFSAHVLNLQGMLGELTERSLVLVDEMGTGTAPEEGAALAVALLDEFRSRRCLVLATTHHDRLKIYASTTPGVMNASVEFDEERLAPTYRLRVGVPGGSSGLAIARRLGLPENVIERANALLTPESQEAAKMIAYLHRSRDALERMQTDVAEQARRLEQERRALREEWVGRQKKRIAELEKRFADALAAHEKEIALAIEAVKDRELRAQLEKQLRRRQVEARSEARGEADAAVLAHLAESQVDLGQIAAPERLPSAEELQPGTRVRVRGFSSPVVLRRRDGATAEVEAGPLRMKVALSEITAIVGDPPAKAGVTHGIGKPGKGAGAKAGPMPGGAGSAADEINVIGCTVEEATERVDKFLDNAAMAEKLQLRIIHGHGTGALRRGLAAFLTGHPLVQRIHAESDERGGTAITVVELKE